MSNFGDLASRVGLTTCASIPGTNSWHTNGHYMDACIFSKRRSDALRTLRPPSSSSSVTAYVPWAWSNSAATPSFPKSSGWDEPVITTSLPRNGHSARIFSSIRLRALVETACPWADASA